MHWYKISAERTHLKNHAKYGKKTEQVAYVWAESTSKVLDRYLRTGGMKRHSNIPLIRQLTDEECVILEKVIIEDKGWNIEKARNNIVRFYEEIPPV